MNADLGTTYSPRNASICKRSHARRPATKQPETKSAMARQRNHRARQEYARLLEGIVGHECWFATLTRAYCADLRLRPFAWHQIRTRLKQRWPGMEALTVYEYSTRSGVHLHVVIRGTPGINWGWMQHVVDLLGDGTKVDFRPVYGARGLAHYLTKTLSGAAFDSAWPRYFRPISTTRGWCLSS